MLTLPPSSVPNRTGDPRALTTGARHAETDKAEGAALVAVVIDVHANGVERQMVTHGGESR